MKSGDPIVSVIIVTHNSEDIVRRCLHFLSSAMSSVSCEVIVVDNSSTDSTPSIVKRSFVEQKLSETKLILNAGNTGFAEACNQGAAAARGGCLLFLNPDVALDSDAIESLLVACRE